MAPACPDPLAQPDPRDPKAQPGQPGLKASPEPTEQMERTDKMEPMEQTDKTVHPALKEIKGTRGILARKAHKVLLDLTAKQEARACQAPRGQKGLPDFLVATALMAATALLERLVPMALTEPMEHQDPRGSLDPPA